MVATAQVIDRAAWLAERRKSIGASEAPIVCGISPWATPLELYSRKLGLIPEQEETESMKLGTYLEPVIAKLYEEKTGKRIISQQEFLKDPARPFITATLDGIDEDGNLVEFKSTSSWAKNGFGEEDTDELPDYYFVQAQQQMHVAVKDVVNFAVLTDGRKFRTYKVRRNQELIDLIIEKNTEFWDRIQKRTPPPFLRAPDGIAMIIANGEAKPIVLGQDTLKLAEDYARLGKEIGELEDQRKQIKNDIFYALNGSKLGILPDGKTISVAEIKVAEHFVKASTQIRMTVKKAKVTQ